MVDRTYEQEGHQSIVNCSCSNITNIIHCQELLSNPDSNVVGTDLNKEFANEACSLEDGNANLAANDLNADDSINNNVIIHPAVYSLANITFECNASTNISDTILEDKTKKTHDTTSNNHCHQIPISQNENTVTLSTRKFLKTKQSNISTSSVKDQNSLCCKTFLIFAMICIIGAFLMPIIFYYINQGNTDSEDTEYSYDPEINTSNTIFKACNFSNSNCTNQLLLTYEALRTINLPSSQQYCSERVETLFCDALMECSNESYVKDIVCQQVRQKYCTAEWRMLEVDNQTDGLTDCTDHGETVPLTCSDQFAPTIDGSVCLPLCEEFSQYSEAYTQPYIVLYAICLLISIIGGIAVLIFSFWKRKKMFLFPQILVPLNAGNATIINILLTVSIVSVGRWNVLCSSKFLFDSLNNPTALCTVQGFVLYGGLNLYSSFWVLYILHLALKMFFPLKSAKLSNTGYSGIIYTTEVVIISLIGIAPSLVSAGLSKYRIGRFPPIYCDGYDDGDRTFIFYSSTVPILSAVCTSLILMLLILYKVHTHQGIFKRKNKGSAEKPVCTCQFTVPEIKIGFVLLYWLILTVFVWTSASIRSGRDDAFAHTLKSYVGCMAGGNRKGHNCHQLRIEFEAESHPVVELINIILIAFLNFATLPFVIQFQTVKRTVRQATRRLSATVITKLKSGSKFNMEEDCEIAQNNVQLQPAITDN